MNIQFFEIRRAREYLAPYSCQLTPGECAYTATVIAIFQSLNQLMGEHPTYIMIDLDGSLAKNPLTYIPPCVENNGRDFLRIYPQSLFRNAHNFRKSWYTIVRGNSGVTYSPDNPRLTTTDVLFLFAVHELRHKLQRSCQIFTPDYVEERKAFLGVALDVHKMNLCVHPEHYIQSGIDAMEREFDAEVIAMYAANLWRLKTPEEMKHMLSAQPA